MSVQIVIDVTQEYNNGTVPGVPNVAQIDVGGFDYAVVQFVNIAGGTLYFKTTNDSGDIQGVSDGNPVSATNWIAARGTTIAGAVGVTSIAADGLVRFEQIGRYLQLDGSTGPVTCDKILVRLYKIH